MTDLRTRPADELELRQAPISIRSANIGKIIALVLITGVLFGWLVTSADPNAVELEQVRWEQVVDYHERQYQTVVGTQSRNEAHWEAVVDYFEQQWELAQG